MYPLLGSAAAAYYRHAVDDQIVSQQLREQATRIRAVHAAITVHDQRAMAVVNLQATVRTTTHAAVVPPCAVRMQYCTPACCGALPPVGVKDQLRFFGGVASRPVSGGFLAFVLASLALGFFAGPAVAGVRRRPPFPVERRCLAASILARRAPRRSGPAAPG